MSLLSLLLVLSRLSYADDCADWIHDAMKGKSQQSCMSVCLVTSVDMRTFDCKNKCDELCKKKPSVTTTTLASQYTEDQQKAFFSLSNLYPLINEKEREVFSKHPKDASFAYFLSWRAEQLCTDIYTVSAHNDESDACRHYVWAFLLKRNFNLTMTTTFLDAHEFGDEPAEERAMDMANNRAGINDSELYGTDLDIASDEIKDSFKKALKNKKLIVLKPKGDKK